MEKIIKHIKRWRYRRLYKRLFFMYASKYESASEACGNAAIAFEWITGREYSEAFHG